MDMVKVEARGCGLPVNIDQCPSCGGIWFDKFELFQADPDCIDDSDVIDETAIAESVPIKIDPHCPHDCADLIRLVDQNIPSTIHIMTCPICAGTYLNHGELREYDATIQQRRHTRNADPRFEALVASSLGHSDHLRALARVGKLLHTVSTNGGFKLPEPADTDAKFMKSYDAELLRSMPADKREKIHQLMVQEREQDASESEAASRVLFGVMTFLKILLRLLLRI